MSTIQNFSHLLFFRNKTDFFFFSKKVKNLKQNMSTLPIISDSGLEIQYSLYDRVSYVGYLNMNIRYSKFRISSAKYFFGLNTQIIGSGCLIFAVSNCLARP